MAIFQNQGLQNERFSLLLLEPGEIYFEDFSVYYYQQNKNDEEAAKTDLRHGETMVPSRIKDGGVHFENSAGVRLMMADGKITLTAPWLPYRQRGHLKICSKSVVFVPKEEQFPVLKIPLKNIKLIEEYSGDLKSRVMMKDKGLIISSDVCIEMKQDSIISPYVFRKSKNGHIFSLNYVTIDDCLPMICQLHRASTLPPADQNAMISAIVLSRQSRVKFNTSWLDDLYEKVELECQADKIMPLVTNPGRVMVTSSRLYFQPFNNVERSPVIKVKLKDIGSIMKRRFLLKQIGLEIKCSEHAISHPHLYLAFKTRKDRDAVYEKILSEPEVNIKIPDQQDMTMKWQNGIISNYDYLMYLNSASDRSFFDLTQYPVMPWVIQDFTSTQLDLDKAETFRDLSKPVGALNSDRLERMKERYVDMPEPKFLYGAHYSTPGYVLFYLSRLVPEYVLCLQNGKFDQPDRMFNSLTEVWQNCLHGAADFKELIPEFFDGTGEFMINSGVCNFGVRQDGRPVGNVELPPWAQDSKDFINKMQEALECEYVSRRLHEWIDLIFGYKQRGEEAEKADNVFHYLTYEGSVDLDSIENPNERAALEIQIMEFGQIPKQLFTTPHPARYTSKQTSYDSDNLPQLRTHEEQTPQEAVKDAVDEDLPQVVDFTKIQELMRFSVHKDMDPDETARNDKLHRFIWTHAGHKRTKHDLFSHGTAQMVLSKLEDYRNFADSLLKLYSLEEQRQLRSVTVANMALSSCLVMPDCRTVICGAWDNNVYFYSVEYGNILDTLHAHDDAVININWRHSILFTASWDSAVKLWTMPCPSAQGGYVAAEYFLQLDHDHGVCDIAVDQNCELLVSATREGQLYIWDLQKYILKNVFQAHEGEINAVQLDPDCKKIVSCGADSYLRVIDLTSGTEIFVKDIREVVLCLAMVNNMVLLGTDCGHIQVWDMEKVLMQHQFTAHKDAVTCLHMTEDMYILSGSKDRSVCLWRPAFK